MPKGNAGNPGRCRGNGKRVADCLGLLKQGNQNNVSRRAAGALFGQGNELVHEPDVLGAIGFGYDQAVGSSLNHGQHIIQEVGGIKSVNTHGPLKACKVSVLQDLPHGLARFGLALWSHRILQVKDQRIRGRLFGLGKEALAAGRDK